MANYITIDGGTTNTRLTLVINGQPVDRVKCSVGARNGKAALEEAIREGIDALLKNNGTSDSDVTAVIASGMITSELGLVALEHTVAPAGVNELKQTMYLTEMPNICDVPFAFIRGIKTGADGLEDADMMRGEETEIMGLFNGEGVYVLPGSHSKAVTVDGEGKIIAFSTFMTGEMIAAITEKTILKDAIDLSCNTDAEYLKKGYAYAHERGLNEALFKVRVLKNLFGADKCRVYSFFMGAVLSGELDRLVGMGAGRYVICGKRQLREPTAELLRGLCDAEVITVTDEQAEQATCRGAVRIFEY
jgi:2-dehydro-3-deoxygalactonokinase